jgi:outer membrane protein OmpA-like peptidoglycan-associated protein
MSNNETQNNNTLKRIWIGGTVFLVLILVGGGWYYYNIAQQKEKIVKVQLEHKKIEEIKPKHIEKEKQNMKNLINNFQKAHNIVMYSLENLHEIKLNNNLIKTIINNEKNKNNFEIIYSKNNINIYIPQSLKSKINKDKIEKITNMLNKKYNKGSFIICNDKQGNMYIYILNYSSSVKNDKQLTLKNKLDKNNTVFVDKNITKNSTNKDINKINNNKKSDFIKVYDNNLNNVKIYVNEALLKDNTKKDELNYLNTYIKNNIKNNIVYINYDKHGNVSITIKKYSKSVVSDNIEKTEKINTQFIKNNLKFSFAFNSTKILNKNDINIFFKNLNIAINKYSIKKLFIVGYTDSIGSKRYNLLLSYKRAKALEKYLKKFNIELVYVGKGENDPIATNETKEGRALNRRVEIIYGY